MNCAALQDYRPELSCTKESSGFGETWTLLIVTREFVKLIALRVPVNFVLKTALIRTVSPKGTDWLLKLVEKHTFLEYWSGGWRA